MMHTPDGFVTSWVCVAMILVSLGFLARAVIIVRRTLDRKKILRMATAASFVFVLQMLNFPVANGTSGHFIGAAFSMFLFGPEAALVILASVIILQSLVYGDGGLLAVGVNTFNMAVTGVYTAYYLKRAGRAVASFGSVVAASLSTAVMIGVSGTIALPLVVSAMIKTHLMIGVGEAMTTLAAVPLWKGFFVRKPDIASSATKAAVFSLALSGAILLLFTPLTSSSPDGLESVAMRLGFFERAVEFSPTPLSGYTFMGASSVLAVVSSGIVGSALSFAAVSLLSLLGTEKA